MTFPKDYVGGAEAVGAPDGSSRASRGMSGSRRAMHRSQESSARPRTARCTAPDDMRSAVGQ